MEKEKAEELRKAIAEEKKLKLGEELALRKIRDQKKSAYQKFLAGFKKEYTFVHQKEEDLKKRQEERLAAIEKAKRDYSGWRPRLWSGNGVTLRNVEALQNNLSYKVNEIPIYVDENNFFTAKLPALKTKWSNLKHLKFIHKSKVDFDDPYFASLVAAYILSYRCGLTKQHLEFSQTTPKIIT